jgi:tetratricopeptide (TPR) repeat protein
MPLPGMSSLTPRSACRFAPLIIVAGFVLLSGCSGEGGSPRYAAEKRLFKARKMRDDLYAGGMKSEFLTKAAGAYRGIVTEYGGAARTVEGLEEIVVSAQMELGELEHRGGLLREARSDFERAIDLAANIPAARANALYSAGVISEELDEPVEAARHFERFFGGFLGPDSLASTARMNPRYLVTPLKLADLADRLGDREAAKRWLEESERICRHVIAHEGDPALVRETRYNLLATYLQQKNWSRGLAFAKELEELYPSPQDRSAIRYIEARIYQDGLGDPERAIAIYVSVVDSFPTSREASDAALAAAGIHGRAGRLDEAAKLYDTIIDSFKDRLSAVVEAHWRMAQIDELRGDREAASLRYRLIYTNYPETLQGFEAPLRIASDYRKDGAADAAKSAYDKALEHYGKLASGQRPMATRIMAEQYVVRTLIESERWEEAAKLLVALPDRFPNYAPFGENYIRAASIFERELGDRGRAAGALETCVARYPGTELARDAAAELARLKR